MKLQNKIKTKVKRRTSNHPRPVINKVVLAHHKDSRLRHFRLINHDHTGRLIHYKHTSHLALILILVIVGIFVMAGSYYVKAETVSSSVTVGVVVPGPAPTIGANITSPVNGSKINDNTIIDVAGTCAVDTFVVVSNNNVVVGSTTCSSVGVFSLTIQLQFGTNILTAMNYDNINQAGPETNPITIYVTKSGDVPVIVEPTLPIIPENPSVVPGIKDDFKDCNDYKPGKLETGGEPRVAIVCVPRFFNPGVLQTMGILVWGGVPPYAINVDWGQDSIEDTLVIVSEPGYKTLSFSYAFPGIYKVFLRMNDKNNQSSIVQTSVQVNGQINNPQTGVDDIIDTSWFNISVPLYVMALSTTIGFWIGDLFDRHFGLNAKKSKKRKKTA